LRNNLISRTTPPLLYPAHALKRRVEPQLPPTCPE